MEKTAHKIWTFEIWIDEPNNKFIMLADGKESFVRPFDEIEDAPHFLKEFVDAWDTEEVTFN